jgi:lipopolysaccharide/colanic/teichoic acid biosynthesis glycosyltransferase
MVRLDLYYVDHWSIWLDLKILLKTASAVIKCKGAV